MALIMALVSVVDSDNTPVSDLPIIVSVTFDGLPANGAVDLNDIMEVVQVNGGLENTLPGTIAWAPDC